MSYLSAMGISASGIYAQRTRMNIIAQNLANINTTRTAEGGPYRRKDVVFSSVQLGAANPEKPEESMGAGVLVDSIVNDPRPGPKKYEPGHPDAGADGYVEMPNVDIIEEMVNMISAARSYEANIVAFQATRQMIVKAIDIGV